MRAAASAAERFAPGFQSTGEVTKFSPTTVKCFIDGAYMDVCVYDNLCFKNHDDLVYVSDVERSDEPLDKHLWHTGGVRCARRPTAPCSASVHILSNRHMHRHMHRHGYVLRLHAHRHVCVRR
jgi:hypothetical protein